MGNCFSCKWFRIKNASGNERARLGITESEIESHCAECVEKFTEECRKKPKTCYDCEWKDRNLPYVARTTRCKVCAETFASMGGHDCAKCVWNNPRRMMPADASLAHCKACLAVKGGSIEGSMNCESCKWMGMPESIRRKQCIKCSIRFAANSKVKGSVNELSNKGQVIISYDNHNENMVDDRDTVAKVAEDYKISRKSTSREGSVHPVFGIDSDIIEETKESVKAAMDRFELAIAEVENGADYDKICSANAKYASEMRKVMAEGISGAYDKLKMFIYEMCQLTDMQVLLLLSEIRGDKKTDFAKNHNLKDTAVNIIFKQIVGRSPVFRDFIILSRGSLKGTRGRKSKDGTSMEKVPKTNKKAVYLGVFQPTFTL